MLWKSLRAATQRYTVTGRNDRNRPYAARPDGAQRRIEQLAVKAAAVGPQHGAHCQIPSVNQLAKYTLLLRVKQQRGVRNHEWQRQWVLQ